LYFIYTFETNLKYFLHNIRIFTPHFFSNICVLVFEGTEREGSGSKAPFGKGIKICRLWWFPSRMSHRHVDWKGQVQFILQSICEDIHISFYSRSFMFCSRWAFIDLSAGPFSWGPAVGGEGVRTEASLPNVERTIGSASGSNDVFDFGWVHAGLIYSSC
jgi:hypothetical protein